MNETPEPQASASGGAPASDRKIDIAFKLLENVQALVRFIDTKTAALLVISGVTTGHVLNNVLNNSARPSCGLLQILYFLAFIAFIALTLLTVFPRGAGHTGNSQAKVIYFGHIADRAGAKDYCEDYKSLGGEKLLEDILYQVYENSKIADRKAFYFRASLIALVVQGILWLLLIISQNLK